MTFQLHLMGGPWGRRLARRRAGFEKWPWHCARGGAQGRWVWTQSALSEYASAAAFAEIAAALAAAGAPIDLVAAAGEFVADEVVHAELCARMANALGGAVPLEVDLERLVRPPSAGSATVRAAERVVRTCCVGEALTVPILAAARAHSGDDLAARVITRILRDEARHAELGAWVLDALDDRLTAEDRAHLGRVATRAIADFAPLFATPCGTGSGHGVLACADYDPVFREAVERRVRRPLLARGIDVPAA